MVRALSVSISIVAISVGLVACQGTGGKNGQRDSKLDAQRQKLEQALTEVESRVDQAVHQAQQKYNSAVRSAQQAKSDLEVRVEQVDRAAQGMVQQAQKVGQMADTAADKAQAMVGAVETAWGDFRAAKESTPVSRR